MITLKDLSYDILFEINSYLNINESIKLSKSNHYFQRFYILEKFHVYKRALKSLGFFNFESYYNNEEYNSIEDIFVIIYINQWSNDICKLQEFCHTKINKKTISFTYFLIEFFILNLHYTKFIEFSSKFIIDNLESIIYSNLPVTCINSQKLDILRKLHCLYAYISSAYNNIVFNIEREELVQMQIDKYLNKIQDKINLHNIS
jgi:hypothetical protein